MIQARRLHPRSIAIGALVYIAIALPAGLIGNAVSDENGSNLSVVLAVVVLVAPLVAGAVAARGHHSTSLMHGAAATAVGWFVTIAITTVGKIVEGKGVPIVASLALGVVSVSFGVIGGYITFRRALRRG